MQFTISDAAALRLQQLQQNPSVADFMRISVLGGGCSGFEYRFEFEPAKAGDDHLFILQNSRLSVIIDDLSRPFLENATLDYVDGIGKAGFTIINPQAGSHCGCGKSFSFDLPPI